jgi:hypothetical protein
MQGVCQGDPISPLLFNFVVDALDAILSKARAAGHIQGVVPHLIPGGVSHLQCADDTIILHTEFCQWVDQPQVSPTVL